MRKTRQQHKKSETITCEDQEELHQCEKCDINARKMKIIWGKWQQHEKSTIETWKEQHNARKATCKL